MNLFYDENSHWRSDTNTSATRLRHEEADAFLQKMRAEAVYEAEVRAWRDARIEEALELDCLEELMAWAKLPDPHNFTHSQAIKAAQMRVVIKRAWKIRQEQHKQSRLDMLRTNPKFGRF